MNPLRIFVGWDNREPEAYHVFAHSLIRHASQPISIIPLVQQQLRNTGMYTRPWDEPASTEFAFTRFLVPALTRFAPGYAIFADCDMLALRDIHELIDHVDTTRTPTQCVWVAKHDYVPRASVKMDGQPQVAYPRKNWSSLMVFDTARCGRLLDPGYVNEATGAQLHRFAWASEDQVGAIPLTWNWLVDEYAPNPSAALLHYTNGGPWFSGHEGCDHADLWLAERELMRGLVAA